MKGAGTGRARPVQGVCMGWACQLELAGRPGHHAGMITSLLLFVLIGLVVGLFVKWAFTGPWSPPFDGD